MINKKIKACEDMLKTIVHEDCMLSSFLPNGRDGQKAVENTISDERTPLQRAQNSHQVASLFANLAQAIDVIKDAVPNSPAKEKIQQSVEGLVKVCEGAGGCTRSARQVAADEPPAAKEQAVAEKLAIQKQVGTGKGDRGPAEKGKERIDAN